MFTADTKINVKGQIALVCPDPFKAATDTVKRYAAERNGRVMDAVDKVGQGRLIDAAMDALQFFSPGSQLADGARAVGLVDSEAQKHLVSGVVNGLLGGPLGWVAAAGDAEDVVQAALPQLRNALGRIPPHETVPQTGAVPMAPPAWAPSPSQQLNGCRRPRGFAPSVSAGVNLKASWRSQQLRVALEGRIRTGGIFGRFARDLAQLSAHYCGVGRARGPIEGARAAGGQSDVGRILSNSALSFEDKLFYFMMLVAKNQEKKMEQMMKKYDTFKAREKQKKEIEKKSGQLQSLLGAAGSVVMLVNPVAGIAVQAAGMVTKELPQFLGKAQDTIEDLTPDRGDGSKLSGKEKEWSEQRWMQELGRLQQQLTRMYNLISNVMKSTHDTQMNAIRNMR